MIKNRIIVAIAAVLVIVLGIQFYIMFRLNDRLKQLWAGKSRRQALKSKYRNYPI
ncbi:MAG: hypothetical protein LUO94_04795 [Methylococcaceae bacterium]|nr:hypothetical protein [Methylococcaceae bacterium]OYV18400.1 MAG: hypothetical protein CG441_1126 [Methylococcaceae bacterium NSM2-1]